MSGTPGGTNGHAASVSLAEMPAAALAGASTGVADALSPSQVNTFTACAARWFFKYPLGLPDPATSGAALGKAVHAAAAVNLRQKIESKEDLETEGVVALYRGAWAKESADAQFRNDEDPAQIGKVGEGLMRLYMEKVAPHIQPAAVEVPLRGVIGGVRINAQPDVIDVNGKIIDKKTAAQTPSSIDDGYRFQVATYSRLAPGASGFVRLDTLVKTKTPKHVAQEWKIDEADIIATDKRYPLAQAAMRSGYYMPNRGSFLCSRRHCPYWRRCEKEFGGEVSEA